MLAGPASQPARRCRPCTVAGAHGDARGGRAGGDAPLPAAQGSGRRQRTASHITPRALAGPVCPPRALAGPVWSPASHVQPHASRRDLPGSGACPRPVAGSHPHRHFARGRPPRRPYPPVAVAGPCSARPAPGSIGTRCSAVLCSAGRTSARRGSQITERATTKGSPPPGTTVTQTTHRPNSTCGRRRGGHTVRNERHRGSRTGAATRPASPTGHTTVSTRAILAAEG